MAGGDRRREQHQRQGAGAEPRGARFGRSGAPHRARQPARPGGRAHPGHRGAPAAVTGGPSQPVTIAAPLRWAEIDDAAIEANAATVRSWLRPGCRLMAMVKSDGYGHGAVTAARATLRGGAAWLGVYTPDEALAVRTAGVDAPILVCGHSPRETLRASVAAQVDVTVFDADSVCALAAV